MFILNTILFNIIIQIVDHTTSTHIQDIIIFIQSKHIVYILCLLILHQMLVKFIHFMIQMTRLCRSILFISTLLIGKKPFVYTIIFE